MPSHGPGADDPFDPSDLDDVLARVVIPVITSLIEPGELERAEVGWESTLSHNYSPWLQGASGSGPYDDTSDLFALVSVRGETLKWAIWQPRFAAANVTLGDVASAFAARAEQWVEECVKRGEEQIANYVIPSRSGASD